MVHGTIASTQVSIHRIGLGIHSLTSGNCVTGGGGAACFEGSGCGSYQRWIKAMLFVVKWGTCWQGFG